MEKMINNENKMVVVMFPYPSGNGLHIGHYYNYAIIDSYCKYLKYNGVKVFQPFGYDAFGLPAENYAKSVGRDPKSVTEENIQFFREQMQRMNTSYEEKVITSDKNYQKWTQWIFTKLKEHDMAYKAFGEVNWCSSCGTVLAREQVIDNHCDRCGTMIEIKEMEQWYFRITKYKERLIKNLEWIDYPKKTITQQRNWLENQHDWCVSRQRKWGCSIPIEGETDTLDTFVDSSFYFIRYCDSENENELCSKEKYKQVDLYVGGSEHACMHLIYARFINMFLYDIGIVSEEEPFARVVHNGMINNNGIKMAKSKGNVINPDNYDSDYLRFYLMFIAHYFDGGNWSDNNFNGIVRFVNKFINWIKNENGEDDIDIESFKNRIFNYTENFKFNKVVSEFMIMINENKHKKINQSNKKKIIELIKIYMPGIEKKF
jgi:leucyl-tRNA synthetase